MAKSTVSLGEDCSRCRAVAVSLPYLSGNIQGSYIGKHTEFCQIPLHSIVKFLYTLVNGKNHKCRVISVLHILAHTLPIRI